jgi:hypothetical protein
MLASALIPVAQAALRSAGEPSLITMEDSRQPNARAWSTTPDGPSIDLNVSWLLPLRETSEVLVRVDRVHVHAEGITLHLSGHGHLARPRCDERAKGAD